MVNEAILKTLINEFKTKNFIPKRREWFDNKMQNTILPLFQKDAIYKLTTEDAKKIYDKMTVGGPKLYPKTFIQNGIDKIKKSLEYLLYSGDSLEQRFFNVAGNVDSEYRLNGTSKAFASTALNVLDPQEYGIWNGAVDGGLRMLDLLPSKERGENIGQRYTRINQVLKELQQRCGLEDLSITDEFVELLFHGKIGKDILKEAPIQEEQPIEEEPVPQEVVTSAPQDPHLHIQWMLIKIGKWEDYDVWVANNDLGKEYRGDKFNTLCLSELPHFAGPEVLRVARSIDVIWFRKRSAQPVRFFEIEHTTSIYSGLLRFNDVKIDYPLPKATIVASQGRRDLFDSQISRRTFVYSELADVCDFMDYNDVERLFESEKVRAEMLKGSL